MTNAGFRVYLIGNPFARGLIPLRRLRTFLKHVLQKDSVCPYQNIYHCSTQKAASQWIKSIFQNVYKYSGLDVYNFIAYPEKVQDIIIKEPFPRWGIVSQLYIDFRTYRLMPKSKSYRTFFILRDPRDIVVSMYFSLRYSHSVVGKIKYHRELLSKQTFTEGIIHAMKHTKNCGIFEMQRSWIDLCDDENVKIFRFEDLVSDEENFLADLLRFCHISVPVKTISELTEKYGFEAMAGRKRGEENEHDHYRKGIAGDWKNYFDRKCVEEFKSETGDLLVKLGYEESYNWQVMQR